MHDVVVPAIFFRALQEGKVTQSSVVAGMMDMTVEFLQWVRLEVRKAVWDMLGLEP